MKIVFVSDGIAPYYKGGKEKRLYELSTRLAQLGHEVHIYTMHWWPTPEKDRIESGVHLHAICRLYPFYAAERRSLKQSIVFSIACLKLFTVGFDVLDVDHMPYFPVFSMWLVCLLRRKKFFGTWHEALSRDDWLHYMGKGGHVAILIERLSTILPHRIIAASEHTKRQLALHHRRNRRVSVVPSGIDLVQIKRVKPVQAACDVLYVGRFVKGKNVDVLIKAIRIVARTNPEVRCTIIGHGMEKAALERLIRRLKLTSHVTLLEPLAEAADIYAYMKRAKVFVLPSVREGFGIVVLEALSCGTPVVTIDSPANAAKDLIIQDKTGSLVPLDPRSLAAAITRWTSSTKPRSIAKIAATYDWGVLAADLASIYAD